MGTCRSCRHDNPALGIHNMMCMWCWDKDQGPNYRPIGRDRIDELEDQIKELEATLVDVEAARVVAHRHAVALMRGVDAIRAGKPNWEEIIESNWEGQD